MTVHVQAWVDLLRCFSEKFETFGNLAWVKSVHVFSTKGLYSENSSRKWISDP